MTSTQKTRPLKVILVGSSGVGKTSLINAFFKQPYEIETQPTVAPAYCGATIELPDKTKVDLQIWDTAGQERFQSIGGMFYRESDIAFICFDSDNKSTISTWVNRVRNQVPNCILFLVATKSDLMSEDEINALKGDEQNILKEFQAQKFFLTSSSANTGVMNLFQSAGQCITTICKASQSATVQIDKPVTPSKGCKC
ncbi:hypothetical protein M9Y10_009575 [Tritrichomonas musculus]|uniref:Small GTP-binding protein n=1 Tax=Tritrichomonas musculus TaxID=1915356 RepID=A0ABR2INQ5_9EUKA